MIEIYRSKCLNEKCTCFHSCCTISNSRPKPRKWCYHPKPGANYLLFDFDHIEHISFYEIHQLEKKGEVKYIEL